MSILLTAVAVAAVLMACVMGYVLGLTMAEMREKPVALVRSRKAVTEPEENPYPIGSDEFWMWQPK